MGRIYDLEEYYHRLNKSIFLGGSKDPKKAYALYEKALMKLLNN